MANINPVEENYRNICTEVIALHGAMSDEQRKEIIHALYHVGKSPKSIQKFLAIPTLSLQEKLDAMNVIERHRTTFKVMTYLFGEGLQVSEAAAIIELKENLGQHPRRSYRNGFPDLSNWVSYRNILFLDRTTGNTHDPDVIEHAIATIETRLDDAESNCGMARMLYEMQRLEPTYHTQVTFDTLIDVAMNSIPSPNPNAYERDDDMECSIV